MWKDVVKAIPDETPVMIAGPTASGKSDLALAIAAEKGGVVINADAMQVFSDWRILTARPDEMACKEAPHELYGHVAGDQVYSAGHWLRDIAPLLNGERPIIVGGTGLYFAALLNGLADIPETPEDIRAQADRRRKIEGLSALLAEIDSETVAKIDIQNPMRVQRAWEVLKNTGRGLASWHADTAKPLLTIEQTYPLLLSPSRESLNTRIAKRFESMLARGLLEEAQANASDWSPARPSAKAIGAAELMQFLSGELTQELLASQVTTHTRQYAKRQRTWFRARMASWHRIDPEGL